MRLTILTLSLLMAGFQPTAFAQAPPPAPAPPVIVVNGDAQLEANPDEATVRLGVVRQAPTAQVAQEQANLAAKEILAAIAKVGVPAQRIQTSRLTLTPIYAPRRPDNNEAPRIAAYSASNIVSVDLDNLAQVGPVIDAGLKTGANQLEGVHFRLKNDGPIRERALREAVLEARRKAEVIAEALGARLGNVVEVSEGGVSVFPKGEFGGPVMARAQAAEFTPTPVSPGQLDVHASVTVKYRILETK